MRAHKAESHVVVSTDNCMLKIVKMGSSMDHLTCGFVQLFSSNGAARIVAIWDTFSAISHGA
jgi:hypothetical protein